MLLTLHHDLLYIAHPRRHNLQSTHNAADSLHDMSRRTIAAVSASQLHRNGTLLLAGSLVFLFSGLFCLLGGGEYLLGVVDPGAQSTTHRTPIFLHWPFSLLYFWPLTIPLGTYLVIARWTGYKHFRHA